MVIPVPPHEPAMMRIKDLHVTYEISERSFLRREEKKLKAIDGIDFQIEEGETFSLVGESGCGKTTTSRAILGVVRPTAGAVEWRGTNIGSMSPDERRRYRRSVQAVFQDPLSSMNPRLRVRDFITEPLLLNSPLSRKDRHDRARQSMERVGLRPDDVDNFPHEFSGGQRQRIAIARTLASSPELIVLDEPVSSLDVSIRAQIMNLLKDLREQEGFAYLFIAHHLATVRYMGGTVGVMYLGRLMELARAEDLFNRPTHPYTRALFAAALPDRPRSHQSDLSLRGDIANALDRPTGCRLRTRCPLAHALCAHEEPILKLVGDGHWSACHLDGSIS